MNVLVTAASKYGATTEIAEAIGQVLEEEGATVAVLPIEQVASVEGFDAVVVGSAVYAGHWMQAARDFVARHSHDLSPRPVWLFSSGPVGDPPKPKEEAVDVAGLVATTGAVEHRTFGGRLARSSLRFPDRAIVAALRVPDGDFRDFGEIRAWGRAIARALARPGAA
jgi:menaquinone-dependent protoporphyrinogen oxidase